MKRIITKCAVMLLSCIFLVSFFPGCKDYDDDIDNLQKQIDEVAADLAALKTTLNGVFKDVSYADGVLTFTKVDGNKVTWDASQVLSLLTVELKGNTLYVNNTAKGSVDLSSIKLEGNTLMVNGNASGSVSEVVISLSDNTLWVNNVDMGKVVIPETTYGTSEDGYLVVNGDKKEVQVVTPKTASIYTVVDGKLVVDGVETDAYVGLKASSFTISPKGFLVVDGEVTGIKVIHELSLDNNNYLVVDGEKTSVLAPAGCTLEVDEYGYLVFNGEPTNIHVIQNLEFTVNAEGKLVVNGEPTEVLIEDGATKCEVRADGYLYINNVRTDVRISEDPVVKLVIDVDKGTDGITYNYKVSVNGVTSEASIYVPVITIDADGQLFYDGVSLGYTIKSSLDDVLIFTNSGITINYQGQTVDLLSASTAASIETVKAMVTSLTYIPTSIDKSLGYVEFFPVIAWDQNSVKKTQAFAYNSSVETTEQYATIQEGWLMMKYNVNPAAATASDIKAKPAFDHVTAYVMAEPYGYAAATGLTIGDWKVQGGVLTVPVKGLKMAQWSGGSSSIPGSAYDDPSGTKYDKQKGSLISGDIYDVDKLAVQITNNLNNVVTSDYSAMKRMVVEQRALNIGLTVKNDISSLTQKSGSARWRTDLYEIYPNDKYDLTGDIYDTHANLPSYGSKLIGQGYNRLQPDENDYTGTTYSGAKNDYMASLESLLELSYYEKEYDLNNYLANYFDYFVTNTDYLSDWGQFILEDYGFKGYKRTFELVSYTKADVNQTYYDVDKGIGYMNLTSNGIVTFNDNAAAIDREPMIKVNLVSEDGVIVMSKLLKVTIIGKRAIEFPYEINDIPNTIVPCDPVSFKIAMDEVLREMTKASTEGTEVSKANFVNWYVDNGSVTYKITRGTTTVANDGTAGIKVENVLEGTGTTRSNYINVSLNSKLKTGSYTVQVTYTSGISGMEFNPVTVTEKFDVALPLMADVLTYKHINRDEIWTQKENGDDDYMTIVWKTSLKDDQELSLYTNGSPVMWGTIDNTDAGVQYIIHGCAKVSFEIASNYTASQVKIIANKDSGNKTGNNEIHLYDQSLVGKRISVRAVYTLDNGEKVTIETFDVIFKNPVNTVLTDAAYALVEDATSSTLGYSVPVYRLFDIYHSGLGSETKVWDSSVAHTSSGLSSTTGWVDIPFRKYFSVKVTYAIADDNGDVVKTRAAVDRYGILTWDRAGGVAVSAATVNVTVKTSYTWCPDYVTVNNTRTYYETTNVPVKVLANKSVAPQTVDGILDNRGGEGTYY